jgi:serine phosphatase RsbU (regulator of sigma subunit)
VLYTDGIIEAINREHKWFGLDNLMRGVQEHIEKPPQIIANEICRTARRFAIGGLPSDDLTAIVLRFEQVE